ncbi:PD-(D/E)XK nuclease superfamily protein [Lachnospiraceae bacterium]|nr:PD-(D/E)XK nuclease superfamily protein [Lachnospiraceae bacterium]
MTKMTSLERDTQSRNRIISDINTNFFVEAGAGSGKTTMLVSRMVAMVEAGIPINKICAITFTKAAAGEFYDRFQKLLIERSNPDYVWKDKGYAGQLPKPTEETIERCAEALKNIDLCFMGTIDSFCGMVLSEHPSEAGIPSDANIVSDLDAEIFYKQQYVKICSGEYGDERARMAGTFRSLHRNAEEVFVQGMSVLMNNRNVHFNYTEPNVTDIDSAFKDERDEIVRALMCIVNHPELKYPSEQKNLAAWERIDDIYKTLRKKWSNNYSNVMYALKSLGDLRLIPEAMNHYEMELDGVFEPGGKKGKWLQCSVCSEDGLLYKLQNLQYGISMAFLEVCVPVIEGVMRDKGYMTFFDYLYYLRNMLRRDAEGEGKLIRYIYDRHSYFLIDEFQDTNPMQAEVFFYLSSEHPVPQWSACEPRPGSLFIVGDPKQSIYRFRSADVTSFLKVKGLFEKNGGSILTLSRNFRSKSTLCEYFNRCFTVMLPEETRDQSKYEEIPVPDPMDDEFQGIYTYRAYTGSLESEHPDETDPVQIAKIIDKLVDNDEFLVRTGDDKNPRKLRYNDVMVITYGKKRLGPIMSYLDMKGIPTRVEGDVPFGSNEALLEIYKIYSAVANENNIIALYGALTGGVIGLTKEEILIYRKHGGSVSLKASFDMNTCDSDTACLVASKIEKLKNLYYKAQRLSPAALFAKIMDTFKIYEYAVTENIEVVYYTLELLRNAEKSGIVVSLDDGAGYIAELLSGESGEERCLSLNDGRDAVHMANLHKVKGLEAPVIILAAATSSRNSSDKRIVHGDDGSKGYLFSLTKSDSFGGCYFETKAFPDEHEDEKAAGAAEGQRLIYVAVTRARNALIICDSITSAFGKESRKSMWSPVMENGLQDIFEATGEYVPSAPKKSMTVISSKLYAEAESTCVLNDRSMETATYIVENPSRLHISSKMSDEQNVNIIEESSAPKASERGKSKNEIAHRFPTLLGTMTHKLMEMLVSTKNGVNTVNAVGEIIREYRTPILEPYEEDLSKALSVVAERIKNGGYVQTNDLPQDILGTLLNAEEVYCEVPFCYSEEDYGKKVWNGIMDVVYCSKGKWHIVDYKTNADGDDLDRKYQAQLSAYIKAFKETTGETADAKTYHIDI